MIGQFLLAAALTVPVPVAADTQQFRGEGSSSFGFAYEYARADALRKARTAGYTSAQCTVIDSYVWPGGYDAWVVLECTN
jgi:hypothetical protein